MKKLIAPFLMLAMVAMVFFVSCKQFPLEPLNNPKQPPVTKPECIDPKLVNPNLGCTTEYDPVCGCDGKTYSNPCEAKKAGLTSYRKGPCKETSCIDSAKIKKEALCPQVFDPVCGCDNVTYSNACEASSAGVTSYTKGKCGETQPKPCIDTTLIDPAKLCPMIEDPVCGCNGVTYSNECIATNSGVTTYTKGECPGTVSCQKIVANVNFVQPPQSDPFTINKVFVEGNCLVFDIQRGGGCKEVEYTLYSFGVMESNPVQTNVFLQLKNNGDVCKALVHEVIRFDLSIFDKEASSGGIIINVENNENRVVYKK